MCRSATTDMAAVEIASNNQRPARVSLKTRFINCSSPARTSSALMNG